MTIDQGTNPTLGPEEREVLAALADALIPSGERMPSAGQARVADEGVDRVLGARPDMAKDLKGVLHTVEGQKPEEAIDQLRSHPDGRFDTLCEVVAGAYFLNSEVRELIGYPGQRDIAIETPIDRLHRLTVPVVNRGHIYRSCP
jgi:NDP-sugar pyrophosphorylase family protein